MSKGLKTFLTVLIVIVIITGVAVGAYFIGKKGIKIPDKAPENEVEVQQSGLVSPEEVEMNGLKITAKTISAPMYEVYGATRGAEAALTLTVTPTPADAELPGAKFTIAFKNASSSWATGKTVTEYVTLSQSNEKAATVSCLKAFGEPIVITYTVTGEKGESKSATYQLDYYKRVNKVLFSIGKSRTDITETKKATYDDINQQEGEYGLWLQADINMTGTIYNDLNLEEGNVTLSLTETFKSLLKTSNYNKDYVSELHNFEENGFCTTNILNGFFEHDSFCKTADFRNACTQVGEAGVFEVNYSVQDLFGNDFTGKFVFGLDANSFPKAVQSVQFADGSQHTF